MTPESLLVLATGVWAIIASLGWLRERQRLADAYTDLSQLIHDHDLTADDLRRTLHHGPIRERLERARGDN